MQTPPFAYAEGEDALTIGLGKVQRGETYLAGTAQHGMWPSRFLGFTSTSKRFSSDVEYGSLKEMLRAQGVSNLKELYAKQKPLQRGYSFNAVFGDVETGVVWIAYLGMGAKFCFRHDHVRLLIERLPMLKAA